jgi:amino acid transporter
MAYLAPLAAAAGYIPFVIGYGNGLGAPLTFLLCGVVLTLFSVGFLAMVRHVPRPGAFYAYVSAGLGKRVGLGTGALTLTFYLLTAVGFYIFGGLAMKSVAQSDLGMDLPWWAYAVVLLIIVGFCSYRGIDFNARVLAVVVALEFSVIMLFNVVTLFRGASAGRLPAEPFTWSAFTSGSIAVAVLFAIAFFVGFESTAIYREEVRRPTRTIPRATYLVIGTISVFYCVTTYCVIAALGVGKAVPAAAADPSGTFPAAVNVTVGHAFSQVVAVMVLTSVLACELAMTNATTRYVYSFGVDRVLPPAVGAVHKRFGSPYRAAIVTNTVTAAGVLGVVLAGVNPQVAYGTFSGVLEFGFEVIVLLVSLAAIVYFQRNRRTGEPIWRVLIAPVLSIVIFGWLLYYSAARSSLLLGTPTPLTPVLFGLLGGALAAGVGLASWLAVRKPDVYARIGRAQA